MQPLACRQAENSSTIQDIAVGKKEPKASSGDLSEWVERCRSRGISIELIELENHKRIVPTKGSDGVQCTVTSVESLLDGRSSLAKAQEVYLYPFTTSDRVIVLQHPDGNWVDAEERARIVEFLRNIEAKN